MYLFLSSGPLFSLLQTSFLCKICYSNILEVTKNCDLCEICQLVRKFFQLCFLFLYKCRTSITWIAQGQWYHAEFCSSLQQDWTDWRKLLVKLSIFFELDEQGTFRQTEETLREKCLLQFEISCVKAWHT